MNQRTLWCAAVWLAAALPGQLLASAAVEKEEASLQVPVLKQAVEAIAVGQEIERSYQINNVGSTPITVKIGSASCGCVSAVLSDEIVAPGRSISLTMKMQANGWRRKTETVTLRTNDPLLPQIELALVANLPPTVVPNPDRIAYTGVQGATGQRFLSLLLPGQAKVQRIRTQHRFVSARVVEREPYENGTANKIEVRVGKAAPGGPFRDELTFDLSGAPVGQIKVPVEGEIEPDVVIRPGELFFGSVPQGRSVRDTLIISSQSCHPFQIRAVKTVDSDLKVKFAQNVESTAHAVEVVFKPVGNVGAVIERNITFQFSPAGTLTVPVVAKLAPENEPTDFAYGDIVPQSATAPDFTARDMLGNEYQLSKFRGKHAVLLTFFPKCFSGGCAGQLASLQKHLPELQQAGVQVIGISVDAAEEQRAFAHQLGLQFPLIPDVRRTICKLYGAAHSERQLAARMSILIDQSGQVRWTDTNIHVESHGRDVLDKIWAVAK